MEDEEVAGEWVVICKVVRHEVCSRIALHTGTEKVRFEHLHLMILECLPGRRELGSEMVKDSLVSADWSRRGDYIGRAV